MVIVTGSPGLGVAVEEVLELDQREEELPCVRLPGGAVTV